MRNLILSGLFTMAVVGGCVGSQGASQVGHSGGAQAEPEGIDAVFSHPLPDSIPGGQRGEQIRLGYQLVVHTQEFASSYVGNGLTCANCHLDAGLDPNSASFVGLSKVYPEYQARAGRVLTLADRINDCVVRSLNGKAIPEDSHKLYAMVAYIEWLSKDVPEGSRMGWRGIPRLAAVKSPNPSSGAKLYTARCAFCHGADGQGTMAAPPLWGDRAFSIGSDMARLPVAASFIKSNMPRTRGWALSDQDAYDVAAYLNARPRPDFAGKGGDWPKGGKPSDVSY